MAAENPLLVQARANVLTAEDRLRQPMADNICGKQIFPSLAELLESGSEVLRNKTQRAMTAFLAITGIGTIIVGVYEYFDRQDGYHVWENKDEVRRGMKLPLWPDMDLNVKIISSGGTVPKRSKYIDLAIGPNNEFLRVYKDHGDIFSQQGIKRQDPYGGGFVGRATYEDAQNWLQIVEALKQPTQ